MAEALVVDIGEVAERLGEDWELLRELAGMFAHDYPRLLQALELAIAACDAEAARRHAHAIKGMAGNLGARRAHEAAFVIEVAGSSGTLPADCARLAHSLRLELDAADRELRRIVEEKTRA